VDHDPLLAAYDEVRLRITDLVRTGASHLDEVVPACPAWTARQLVAHLVGLAGDMADGNLDGWATDEWTARHVERFGRGEADDLLERWGDLTPRLAGLPPFGTVPATAFAFGDAVVHEADLRPVLDPGSRVPELPVAMAIAAGVGRWRSVLGEAGVPALHLTVPGLRDWWLGDAADPRAVDVEAPAYEVFRALYGRRSREQVAAWSWSAPPEPFLDAGLPFPFAWAGTPLVD
jgi:hypothetical protein